MQPETMEPILFQHEDLRRPASDDDASDSQTTPTNNNNNNATSPDQAIDDESSDLDGEFAELQKMMSQRRRAAKDDPVARLLKALPCIKVYSPLVRPLTIADLDACVALENAAFPNPEHRASPEKFAYRLSVCGELSLGVFVTVPRSEAQSIRGLATLEAARPVETGRPDEVSVLLAHIVSTRIRGDVITDADMAYPPDWREGPEKMKKRGLKHEDQQQQQADDGHDAKDVGHYEGGKTVGIHSLAVLPLVQCCGVGQLIMKAYLDQMINAGVVDSVALICQEHLIVYYQRFGFHHVGPSKAQFGGGGWHNMVHDLTRFRKSSN